jgi:hypothetical protein
MRNNYTVSDLRKLGYKVFVIHIRFMDMDNSRFARGGKTLVEIHTPDGVINGVAFCSLEDNYNKKIGVKIAIGRALAGTKPKLNSRKKKIFSKV